MVFINPKGRLRHPLPRRSVKDSMKSATLLPRSDFFEVGDWDWKRSAMDPEIQHQRSSETSAASSKGVGPVIQSRQQARPNLLWTTLKRNGFIIALLCAVGLAFLFPSPGAKGGWLHPDLLNNIGVALILFVQGLAMAVADRSPIVSPARTARSR